MITIHSDDYGYKKYTDKKIVQLVKNDRIKRISVLLNMADKDSLKALKKVANKKLGIKIGLHLNLVEGRSMTGKQYISSLVNQKGTFFPLWKVVTLLSLGKIDKQHIAREVTRQITLLKKAGYKVSFINSHQHLHALSPVAEIVTEI